METVGLQLIRAGSIIILGWRVAIGRSNKIAIGLGLGVVVTFIALNEQYQTTLNE